jgi:hypothetical protein
VCVTVLWRSAVPMNLTLCNQRRPPPPPLRSCFKQGAACAGLFIVGRSLALSKKIDWGAPFWSYWTENPQSCSSLEHTSRPPGEVRLVRGIATLTQIFLRY